MVKNKKVLIAGAAILAIILIAGGAAFALTHKTKKSDELSLLKSGSDPYSTGTDTSLSPGTGSTGGLNVAGGSGTQLGQIGGTQANQSGLGVSSGSSAGGSSAASNANSSFDPATFAQYDKYKDGTSAMFADVSKGDGAEFKEGMKGAVYYRGWLTNGTLFDQSKNGSDGKLEPFVFELGAHQVIPGWEQALSGMKVGGVRLVIVPPSVGYGATGQGSIPGNAVLVFQVQLGAAQ